MNAVDQNVISTAGPSNSVQVTPLSVFSGAKKEAQYRMVRYVRRNGDIPCMPEICPSPITAEGDTGEI